MQSTKTASVGGFLLLSFVIVVFVVVLPLVTLLPQTNQPKIGGFLFGAVFLILMVDLVWHALRQALAIREEVVEYKATGLVGKVSAGFKYWSIYRLVITALFFSVILGVFLLVVSKSLLSENLSISVNTVVVLLGYLCYFPLRFLLLKIFSPFFVRVNKYVEGVLPILTVQNGVITLNLNFSTVGKAKLPPPIVIQLNELEEVKFFNSFQEAQAFVEYSVGPNVKLAAENVSDQISYLKGSIPRPKVYIQGPYSTGANILLRGKDLFYLITIKDESAAQLKQAFEVQSKPIS